MIILAFLNYYKKPISTYWYYINWKKKHWATKKKTFCAKIWIL